MPDATLILQRMAVLNPEITLMMAEIIVKYCMLCQIMQNIFSSSLISKNFRVKIYSAIIMFYMGVKLGLSL
jgi:hypothetical protein